jgi:hypothetical protein
MIKNRSTTTVSPVSRADLIMLLLKEHNETWRNSKNITEIIKKEEKFDELKTLPLNDIRAHLDALVLAKKLRSHKSDKGNWLLYKI